MSSKSPSVNIVMPMAGRGSRFADLGYNVPKPLIDVRGRPMYSWATDGLPLDHCQRLIFICLREHLENWALARDIEARYERFSPIIVALDGVTRGQACTALMASEWIENDDRLLIFNADTFCRTTIMKSIVSWSDEVAGGLDVFSAPGDRWSFARLSGSDRVVETAEKLRISEWASTGLYYFRRGIDFVRQAKRAIAESGGQGGEFYIAPLYNRMINEGGDIRANFVSEFWAMGTPDDLADFNLRFPV